MAMNFAPLDCSSHALLLSGKKFTWIFPFQSQKTKKSWLPQQKMVTMGGTFTSELNSSYTITDSKLVRIGAKKFLEKNHVLPPSI
jgi:hypothetical protein